MDYDAKLIYGVCQEALAEYGPAAVERATPLKIKTSSIPGSDVFYGMVLEAVAPGMGSLGLGRYANYNSPREKLDDALLKRFEDCGVPVEALNSADLYVLCCEI